ncbi:hypothetical protein ES707_11824 [subsurface metagenome]
MEKVLFVDLSKGELKGEELAKMNAELVSADCTADSEVSHGALYGLASESAHTTAVWNTQGLV